MFECDYGDNVNFTEITAVPSCSGETPSHIGGRRLPVLIMVLERIRLVLHPLLEASVDLIGITLLTASIMVENEPRSSCLPTLSMPGAIPKKSFSHDYNPPSSDITSF
ncbi:uncharacterized protein [Dysidea avara]|uniref:uncharacterized protein n=1 Tax=Dysidea avara TaxID=196820 RepID=UPI00332DCF9C